MKVKHVAIAVIVLSVLSGIAYFAQRGRFERQEQDPRIGSTLLKADEVRKAASLRIKAEGETVLITRTGEDQWVVGSYHDLPVDFSNLSHTINAFLDAKVMRLVTSNPARLERLGLSRTLELIDADGTVFKTITVGEESQSPHGRFVTFDAESTAYLAELHVLLDAYSKGWAADELMAGVSASDVAQVEILFADQDPFLLSRPDASSAFTASDIPEGKSLARSRVDELIRELTSLRFMETADRHAHDVVKARENSLHFRLKTFAGETFDIRVGRRPEGMPAAPGSAAENAPRNPDLPVPPGPVYAFVSSSQQDHPANRLMEKRAYEVSEYTITLPDSPAHFLEEPPAPVSPAPTGS